MHGSLGTKAGTTTPFLRLAPGTRTYRKPASEAGFRLVGAARFELATFRPPAELQSVSMRPGASDASISSTRVDILDALDVAVGTKAVPRQLERLAEGS